MEVKKNGRKEAVDTNVAHSGLFEINNNNNNNNFIYIQNSNVYTSFYA